MPDTTLLQNTPTPVRNQAFACRLLRKDIVIRGKVVPLMAEIELENLSNSELEIRYQMAVLQYLNLIITDVYGNIVSEGHFGDRFSPFADARSLRLAPGEKYRENVHLLATRPRGPIQPATYYVTAIYEYDGFRAVSETVEVTV